MALQPIVGDEVFKNQVAGTKEPRNKIQEPNNIQAANFKGCYSPKECPAWNF